MSGVSDCSLLRLFDQVPTGVVSRNPPGVKRKANDAVDDASSSKRINTAAASPASTAYEMQRDRLRAECESLLQLPIRPSVFCDALTSFRDDFAKTQQQEKERRRIRGRDDVATNPTSTVGSLGDERLKKLRYYLNNTGFDRSADQILFHEHFIQACLPLIYGVDWDRNSVRVMEEFDIVELKSEVLCMTPRRFGKSFAVAMFVASMMLAVPGIKQAVFSPGKRASTSLMKLVMKFLKNIPGALKRIAGQSDERLYVSARELADGVGVMSQHAKDLHTAADTSELCCFPSSTKGQLQTRAIHFMHIYIYYTSTHFGVPPLQQYGQCHTIRHHSSRSMPWI